jgi:hypothetical protein
VVDRLGELEDLEQAGGRAAEHRQPTRALGLEAVAQLAAQAIEVGLQRLALGVVEALVLLGQPRRPVQQRAHLGAPRGRRRELARIQVHEEREHLRAAGARLGQPAQALAGDVVSLHGR